MKSVVVITPTIGSAHTVKAFQSVCEQDYKGPVRHLLVVDGKDYHEKFDTDVGIAMETWTNHQIDVVKLTDNTGATGGKFWGHRIYAGFSHLVNEDYVFFLDADNWYEPNHISSLVMELENDETKHIAFSLRNVTDESGTLLCKDDCESLGKWPIWNNPQGFHIDTSAYAFKRPILIRSAAVWHQGYGGDRIFLNTILQNFGNGIFVTNGKYTLNYRLGSTQTSADPNFFKVGNEHMEKAWKGEFPWRKND